MNKTESGQTDAALVLADLGGGGAQRVATNLANRWAAQGRHIAIVTFAPVGDDAYPLHGSVHRLSVGGISRSTGVVDAVATNVKRIRMLRKALKSLAPKVAIGFVGPTNILLVLAAIGLKLRVVVSERNDPARQSFGRAWDFLRRRIYRHADQVTANSHGALESLSRFVPREKLIHCPNPAPAVPEGSASPDVPGPAVLAVGRLHPQKAYDVLLPAFARFRADHPEWQLWIAGEGALRASLQEQASQLGIAPAVHWLGHVSDPFTYYKAAEIFALSSRHEGMPNVLLEAMAAGLVPVVSDCSPGPLELVVAGESGLVTPCEDEAALSDALSRLAGDPELRRRLAQGAVDRMQHYSEGRVFEIWEQIAGCWPAPGARIESAGGAAA